MARCKIFKDSNYFSSQISFGITLNLKQNGKILFVIKDSKLKLAFVYKLTQRKVLINVYKSLQ